MTPDEIARWIADRKCRALNDPDTEGCPAPDQCECKALDAIAAAIAAERSARETAETQAKTAADDMWKAVIRADGLEEEIARRDEEVAALRAAHRAAVTIAEDREARAERAEAERNANAIALAQAVKRADQWEAEHTRQAEQTTRERAAREKAEADLADLRGQLALNTYGPFEESVQAIVARAQRAEAERDEAIRELGEEGRRRGKAEAERDVAARCLKMWEQASKQADDRADTAREAALREAAEALRRKAVLDTQQDAIEVVLALIDKPLVRHASDCAVHNEPYMPNGPCDCGADKPQEGE